MNKTTSSQIYLLQTVETYCVFLGTLKSPCSPVTYVGVLPQRLSLLPHEMVVGPQWQIHHVRYVVIDGPRLSDGSH